MDEQVWTIVQEVAEVDSTYYEDNDGYIYCPFCTGGDGHAVQNTENFPHEPSCIVVKARTLIQQRKERSNHEPTTYGQASPH